MLKNTPVPAEFITWPQQNTGKVIAIDYIFVMGDLGTQTSEGFVRLKQVIQTDYEEIFNEENCHLFKIKK